MPRSPGMWPWSTVSQMQLGSDCQDSAAGSRCTGGAVVGGRGAPGDNYLCGATKVGLDAWANGLADALADEPIRILVVRPGMVRTRMSAGHKEPPFTCDPEDVAEAVAKNLRSGPITGLPGSTSVTQTSAGPAI